MTLHSVEPILSLAYPQTSATPRTLTALLVFPPSTTANVKDLLVLTLCGMQTELSNLSSVVSNLSAIHSSSSTADNDDDTNLTGNTDDSVLAYFDASKCLDFYLGWG